MISLLVLRGIFERGIIFALLPASMHITARILRFDDLTLEGAFGLASGITSLMLTHHYSIVTTIFVAALSGAICGAVTSILHSHVYLNQLISGIITSTALFSITLKVAGAHRAFSVEQIFVENWIWMTSLVCILLFLVYFFLKTEIGFLLYAVGDNKKVITGLSKSPALYQLVGLMLANALVGISGALFTYYLGYYSIWSNVGMLVVALASLILAESVTNKFNIFLVVGSFLYQMVISITYSLHIDQDWNKFITAATIVICIFIQKILKRKS